MNPENFFATPQNNVHRQYEALRAYFVDNYSAKKAAERFGYTINAFYSLVRDFKKTLSGDNPAQFFFTSRKAGRKPMKRAGKTHFPHLSSVKSMNLFINKNWQLKNDSK